MAITKQTPRTVHLGGDITVVNDLLGSGAITPGYLVERFNSSGTPKFRAHSTASGMGSKTVALENEMLNKGIDDAWADGDLILAGVMHPGATAQLILASGETVVAGDFLESKGDGTMRKYTSGVRLFQVLEGTNNTAGSTTARVKSEAL